MFSGHQRGGRPQCFETLLVAGGHGGNPYPHSPSTPVRTPTWASILRELSLAQGAGLSHSSHDDSISHVRGAWYFSRAFKCIILSEAHSTRPRSTLENNSFADS